MNWNFADVMKVMAPELDRRQAQAAVDLAQHRKDLLAERASVAKLAEKSVTASSARDDKLKAAVVEAQAALTAVQRRRDEANRQAAAEMHPLTKRLSDIDCELWATQPDAARHAVTRVLGLCDATSKLAAEVSGMSWDGRRAVTWSNHEQVGRRLDAIMDAVQIARGWATVCVDEADLERRFTALVDSLPVVDQAPAGAV